MGTEQEILAALVVPSRPSDASEWTQCPAPGRAMPITTMPQALTPAVPTAAAASLAFQNPGAGCWIFLGFRWLPQSLHQLLPEHFDSSDV